MGRNHAVVSRSPRIGAECGIVWISMRSGQKTSQRWTTLSVEVLWRSVA